MQPERHDGSAFHLAVIGHTVLGRCRVVGSAAAGALVADGEIGRGNKRREALGFSQENFADEVGMHRTYYGNVELGKNNLTLKSLLKISEGLKRKLGDLLTDAGL